MKILNFSSKIAITKIWSQKFQSFLVIEIERIPRVLLFRSLKQLDSFVILCVTLFRVGWDKNYSTWGFFKITQNWRGQRPVPTFQTKFSFTHFQFFGCFHAPGEIFDGAEFFWWRQHLLVSDVNLHFSTIYPFKTNDPSLESYCDVLYEFLCFSRVTWFFCWRQ